MKRTFSMLLYRKDDPPMADIKGQSTTSTISRTYREYRDAAAGWGTECYFGLVVQAFDQRPDETVDFETFDDAFLKELAGLLPDAELPLKSNEIFDKNTGFIWLFAIIFPVIFQRIKVISLFQKCSYNM